MHCDKTEERSVHIVMPYERSFSLVFWEEEWLMGATLLTFWVKRPRWSEIADFEPIFAHSTSAVTPSEKSSIKTNRSPLRAFQWAQYEHRMLSISPQKGAQKRKTAVFPIKLYFAWRKSATKFLCVKTVSDKVVGHLLAQLTTPLCCRAFPNCDKCSICVAIITMEYQITNNVHLLN